MLVEKLSKSVKNRKLYLKEVVLFIIVNSITPNTNKREISPIMSKILLILQTIIPNPMIVFEFSNLFKPIGIEIL